jgi:hypothetical protein
MGQAAVIERGRVRFPDSHGLDVRMPEGILDRYLLPIGSGEFASVKGRMLNPYVTQIAIASRRHQ